MIVGAAQSVDGRAVLCSLADSRRCLCAVTHCLRALIEGMVWAGEQLESAGSFHSGKVTLSFHVIGCFHMSVCTFPTVWEKVELPEAAAANVGEARVCLSLSAGSASLLLLLLLRSRVALILKCDVLGVEMLAVASDFCREYGALGRIYGVWRHHAHVVFVCIF